MKRPPCSLPFVRFHEGAENGIHAAQVPVALFPKPFQPVRIDSQMNRRLAGRRHHHAGVAPEIIVHSTRGRIRTGGGFAPCTFSLEGFGRVLPRIVAYLRRPLSMR